MPARIPRRTIRGLGLTCLLLGAACGADAPPEDDGAYGGPGAASRGRFAVVPRVPRTPPGDLASALGNAATIDYPPGLVFRCPEGWEIQPTPLGSFALGPPPGPRSFGATRPVFSLANAPGATGLLSASFLRNVKSTLGPLIARMEETVPPTQISLGEVACGIWRYESTGFAGGSVLAIYTVLEDRRRLTVALSCPKSRLASGDRIVRAVLATVRICAPECDPIVVGRWRAEPGEAQGEGDPVAVTEFRADGTFEMYQAVRQGTTWHRKEGDQSLRGDWALRNGVFYAATVEGQGLWKKSSDVAIDGEAGRRRMKAVFVGGQEALSYEVR